MADTPNLKIVKTEQNKTEEVTDPLAINPATGFNSFGWRVLTPQDRRKIGRTKGKFSRQKEKLFDHLKKNEPITDSMSYLAARVGVSTRQLYRYLRALEKENRVYFLEIEPTCFGVCRALVTSEFKGKKVTGE